MTDEKIIELIAQRKEHKAFVKLYRYQTKVEKLIVSRGETKQTAKDIFQDALVILCKKIWAGGFTLTSSIDTYLYGVSYNLWRDELKRSKKLETDKLDKDIPFIDDLEEAIELERKVSRIESVLRKIGEPCMKLLKLFYYEAKKMKEIAEIMGYSSEKTAKTQKYKCIEKAKKQIAL